MRICVLCPNLGLVYRGAERFVEDIYNYLSKKYSLDVYSLGDFVFNDKKKTIKINGSNQPSAPKFFPLFIKYFIESFYFCKNWFKFVIKKNKKYDLIINNAGIPGSYFCSKYRKIFLTPYITICQGGREEIFNTLFKPNYLVVLNSQIENLFKKISNFFSYDKKRIIKIPHAIDVNFFSKINNKILRKVIEKYDLKNIERPIIFSSNALVPFKRNDLLIKACSLLKKCTLIICGTGSEKDKILKMGKCFLGNRFRYLGVIKDKEELKALYHLCDVFSLASKREPFGITYLEAMAANKPIVTQKDLSRKEIIGKAGILIDCKNIKEYAKALNLAFKKNFRKYPFLQAKKFDYKKVFLKYERLISLLKNEKNK